MLQSSPAKRSRHSHLQAELRTPEFLHATACRVAQTFRRKNMKYEKFYLRSKFFKYLLMHLRGHMAMLANDEHEVTSHMYGSLRFTKLVMFMLSHVAPSKLGKHLQYKPPSGLISKEPYRQLGGNKLPLSSLSF